MTTTYFKNLIMDNLWKTGTDLSPLPASFYLGYSTTAPAADGTGVSEPAAATGYARMPLADTLGKSANGVVSNSVQINMPETTANQGVATHYVVFDAAQNGALLCGGALEKTRIMEENASLIFKPGTITISLVDTDPKV